MTETQEVRLATRTRVQYGVELPWEERERYGSDLRYPKGHAREGEQMYPDRQPTGTIVKTGTAFVPLGVLEELLEADHSLGMGDAYLVGYREGMALEKAGLARQETRGGYYTREEERERLRAVLKALWAQYEEAPKADTGE